MKTLIVVWMAWQIAASAAVAATVAKNPDGTYMVTLTPSEQAAVATSGPGAEYRLQQAINGWIEAEKNIASREERLDLQRRYRALSLADRQRVDVLLGR